MHRQVIRQAGGRKPSTLPSLTSGKAENPRFQSQTPILVAVLPVPTQQQIGHPSSNGSATCGEQTIKSDAAWAKVPAKDYLPMRGPRSSPRNFSDSGLFSRVP